MAHNGDISSNQYECLLDIIKMINTAPTEIDIWPKVAECIRGLIGGHTVNLGVINKINKNLDYIYSSTFSDSELNFYDQEIINNDMIMSLYDKISPGESLLTQDQLTDYEQTGLECYQRFYEPADHRYFNAGLLQRSKESLSWISVVRGKKEKPFNKSENRLMKLMIPHLQNSFSLKNIFFDTYNNSILSIELLYALSYGLLFFNDSGDVVFNNRKVEFMLNAGEIKLADKKLYLPINQRFIEVGNVIDFYKSDSICDRKKAIPFFGKDRRRYCLITIPFSSLSQHRGMHSKIQTSTVGILIELSEISLIPKEVIMSVFNLSLRESMLCQKLLLGLSVSQAAKSLGITSGTARFYLKNIFQKTGVKRQSELILLFINLNLSGVKL